MSTLAKRLTCVAASLAFAVAMLFTGTLAFGGEASLDKIQDTLNNLYSNANITAQDVYGVFADEYCTTKTVETIGEDSDTAIDLIKADGTLVYHTSNADTKLDGETVWSDYKFVASSGSSYPAQYEYVGRTFNYSGMYPVKNKNTSKYGILKLDGSFAVPVQFDYVHTSDNYIVTEDIHDTYLTISLYAKNGGSPLASYNLEGYTTPAYLTFYGDYFSYWYSGLESNIYFKYEDNKISKRDDIKLIQDLYFNNWLGLIHYSDGSIKTEKTDGTQYSICTSDSGATVKGSLIYSKINGPSTYSYFTFFGNDVTANVPSGSTCLTSTNYSSIDLEDFKTVFYVTDPSQKSTILNYLGEKVAEVDGKYINSCGNYCFSYFTDDTKTYVNAYKLSDYSFYKKIKEIEGVASSASAYYYPTGYVQPIYWVYLYVSQSSWGASYFNTSLEEIERPAASDSPSYVMNDGKKVYKTYNTELKIYQYLDSDDNQIVINGYTLSPYYHDSERNDSLQHNSQDIWWAYDSNGKYGAIKTDGTVVVPFEYDKISDAGYSGVSDAMGYKDGSWVVIKFGNQPIGKPSAKVDSTTTNSITLSWDAVSGADKYAVSLQKSDGTYNVLKNDITDTTYTISGLAENTEYKILVQAGRGSEWSSYTTSDLVTAKTKESAPTPAPQPEVDSVSDSTISLSWEAIEGATKYAVALLNDDGKTYTLVDASVTGTSYTIRNLECGKTYKILVQAFANNKWSSNDVSNCVSATTKSTSPKAEATATGDGQVTITWSAVENATKYAISEVVNGSFVKVNYDIPSTNTSYVVSDLVNKQQHTFIVQAMVNGSWSKFGSADYCSATPDGYVKPYDVTDVPGGNSIALTWGRVSGATAYAVAIKTGENSYDIKTTSVAQTAQGVSPTYTVTGLKDSTTYIFLVQAMVNGKWNTFDADDLYEASTVDIRPDAEAAATENAGEITVSWDLVEGATNYACSEYLGNGNFNVHILDSATATSYTYTDLVAQREHKFLVQAYVAGSWSSYTLEDLVEASPIGAVKPAVSSSIPASTSIELTWPRVTGATAYAVSIKKTDGSYDVRTTAIAQPALGTATVSYDVFGLKDSTEYKFLVQAMIDGHWSAYDESKDLYTKSTVSIKPTAKAEATANAGEITISWAAVEGATKYAYSEYLGNGNFNVHVCDDATKLSYTLTDLVVREHKYLVQAFVAGSWSSYDIDKDLVSATPKGDTKPVVASHVSGATSVELTWARVPGATMYAAAVKRADGGYDLKSVSIAQPAVGTATVSYAVTGLQNSTEYKFLVQAMVDGHWTSYDESTDLYTASTTNTKPVVTAAPTANDGEILVSWQEVANATNYACSELLPNGQFDTHILDSATVRSYTASDLVAGREHKFLVQAYVAGSWSSYTMDDLKGATPTGATYPTISSQSVTDSSITVSWGAVTGSEQYAASISTDGVNWTINKLDKTKLTYTFTGLKANTTYKVLIQRYADGAWSQNASVDITTDKTKTAVAVYNDSVTSNPSLTFYYDSNDHSSEGTPYSIPNTGSPAWISAHSADIITVNFDSSFAQYKPTSCSNWFYNMKKLTTINDIKYLYTSECTNFSYMFKDCTSLTTLDIENFNTQKAAVSPSTPSAMDGMFMNCSKLSSLKLPTSLAVTNCFANGLFEGCTELTDSCLSGCTFDVSNAKYLTNFFKNCESLTSLDLSGWNISKADTFSSMFNGCKLLKTIKMPTSLCNQTSSNIYLGGTFSGCSELTSIDLSCFESSYKSISYNLAGTFQGCTSLVTIYSPVNADWSSNLYSTTFDSCSNLVGGAGTSYSASMKSSEYAKVDGGNSDPGYFTAKA